MRCPYLAQLKYMLNSRLPCFVTSAAHNCTIRIYGIVYGHEERSHTCLWSRRNTYLPPPTFERSSSTAVDDALVAAGGAGSRPHYGRRRADPGSDGGIRSGGPPDRHLGCHSRYDHRHFLRHNCCPFCRSEGARPGCLPSFSFRSLHQAIGYKLIAAALRIHLGLYSQPITHRHSYVLWEICIAIERAAKKARNPQQECVRDS